MKRFVLCLLLAGCKKSTGLADGGYVWDPLPTLYFDRETPGAKSLGLVNGKDRWEPIGPAYFDVTDQTVKLVGVERGTIQPPVAP